MSEFWLGKFVFFTSGEYSEGLLDSPHRPGRRGSRKSRCLELKLKSTLQPLLAVKKVDPDLSAAAHGHAGKVRGELDSKILDTKNHTWMPIDEEMPRFS